MNNQAGKGSKQRPTDKRTFDANYDAIVWNKTKGQQVKTDNKKGKTSYKY